MLVVDHIVGLIHCVHFMENFRILPRWSREACFLALFLEIFYSEKKNHAIRKQKTYLVDVNFCEVFLIRHYGWHVWCVVFGK